MTDLIRRDDAIRELNGACSTWEDDAKVQEIVMAIPSEKPTCDLISRADAIEAVRKELVCDGRHETHDKTCRFIADVLLSALPSADAVSREVYDKRTQADERIIDSYRREFSEVASAEAVQRWVPCSERLPEFPFISCDAHGNLHIPQGIFTFEDSRGTWCIDDVYDDKQTLHYGNRIIAWMPLPTPYKGGGEE